MPNKLHLKGLPPDRQRAKTHEVHTAKRADKRARHVAGTARRLQGLRIVDTFVGGAEYDVAIDQVANTANVRSIGTPLGNTGCVNITGTHNTSVWGVNSLCDQDPTQPQAASARISHIDWPTPARSQQRTASAPAPGFNATLAMAATVMAVAFPPNGR